MLAAGKRTVLGEYIIQATLLVVLLAVAFPGVFLNGEMISPAEILFQIPPWQDYAPDGWEKPQNPLMADVLTLFHPWYAVSRQCLEAGEWPLWNHREFAGLPLLANYQSAVFYPPRLLHAFLDLHLATTLYILLKLWLSGMAAYLCARAIKLGVPASRFCSIAWMFASYNMVWANWCLPDLSPWLALMFVGAEYAFQARYRRSFFTMAVGATLLLLAGHPVTACTMSLGLGLYVLIRLACERRWKAALLKPVAVLAGGWLLALMFCAVQLLPFVEYVANKYSGTDIAAFGAEPGLPLSAAAEFWVPRFFGTAADDNFWGERDSNRYSMIYPGIAVWLGLVFAFAKSEKDPKSRARAISLAVAAALGILLTFEVYPFSLFHELPFFRDVKRTYHMCFAVFALPMLGAIGADNWFAQKRPAKRLLPALLLTVAASAFLWGIFSFNSSLITIMKLNDYISRQLLTASLFACVGLAVFAARAFLRRAWVCPTLLTIVLACDLLAATWGLNPTIDPAHLKPATKLTDRLSALDQPCRIGVAQGGIPGGIMASYGIEEWLGEDGMYPARIIEFMKGMGDDIWETMEPACAIGYYLHDPRYEAAFPLDEPGRFEKIADAEDANGLELYRNNLAFPRAYLVGQARVITDPKDMFDAMKDPSFDPSRTALLEAQPASPMPDDATKGPVGHAQVVERHATRVQVKATADERCVLVLADAFYPGWKATVDGVPAEIFPVFHAFRGIIVDPGEHIVEYTYFPPTFAVGLGISIASLVAALIAAIAMTMTRQGLRGNTSSRIPDRLCG